MEVMDANFQVEILKRQYLQLIDPEELRIPPYEILRLPETQAYIYSIMFEDSKYRFEPPEHYKFRVLKKLVNELEVSVQDPDEDVGFICSSMSCVTDIFSLYRPLHSPLMFRGTDTGSSNIGRRSQMIYPPAWRNT